MSRWGINNSFRRQTRFGWTAGAGIEAAFTDNLTVRIEYLFADLGDATCNTTLNRGLDKTNTRGERHGEILKQHHPAGGGLPAPLT
jgi:opacity protein-like surface antigen